MLGLSPSIIEQIKEMLNEYFDETTLALLGIYLDEEIEELFFDESLNSITSIYMKALNTSAPTEEETDVLKGLLSITNDYLGALKEETKAKITNSLNSYVQSQSLKKEPIEAEVIEMLVEKQMETAGNKLNIIASAQSNTTKNIGLLSAFGRMSEQNGEEEAIVFFRPVPVDERTAPATLQVHLLPDQVTPRLYKISEINTGYYKKGDKVCSIHGTHPGCRCVFSYLARSYDFDDKGKVIYKEKGFDALKEQRKKYPLT